MVRFVYFDAGGTLLAPMPSVGAVYLRAGAPHGLTASAADLDAAFRLVWRDHARAHGIGPLSRGLDDAQTRAWWRILVDRVLDEVGFGGDRQACFDAMFDAFGEASAWRVYDDVLPVLEAFRTRGVGMGVLSNWDYRLTGLLAGLDLARWFHPVVVSALVGMEKPDPAFYTHAIERVGLPPSEILYVGDHVDLDLEPALSVGLRAYLIDRAGRSGSPHAIRSLSALLDPPEVT